MQSALESAKPGSDMARLADGLKAQAYLRSGEYRGERNNEAVKKLNAEVEALKKGPAGQELQRLAAEARKDAFGNRDLGQEQADYLASEQFKEQMAIAGPELQGEVAKRELSKLAMVDPKKAQTASEGIARQMANTQMVEGLKGLNEAPDGGQYAVEQALKDVGGPGGAPKAAKAIAKAFTDGIDNPGNVHQATEQALAKIGKDVRDKTAALKAAKLAGDELQVKKLTGELGTAKKALGILDDLNQKGALGTFGGLVGGYGLATGGIDFSSTKNGANTLSSMAGVAGSADDMLKVASFAAGKIGAGELSSVLGKTATKLGASTAFQALGPAGDVLSMVSEGIHTAGEIQRGDVVGATLSSAATAGYGTAAGLGIAAIALASGPLGWAALGVSVAAVGLSAASRHYGETDVESYLKRGFTTSNGETLRLIR